jgi:MSHA biogenesis protein MshJ
LRRERILVAIGLVLGPMLLVNTLLLEPAANKAKAARQALRQADLTRNDLVNQLVALQAALQNSPDVALKAELQKISDSGADSNARLSSLRKSLVSPAEMSGMLEQLLARHPGLRLVGLRTLPPESLLPKAAAPDTPEAKKIAEEKSTGASRTGPAFDLFRHGVEVKLEGGFADFYGYLAQLERQEKRLLWGSLRFEVVEHPKARLTLVIYTLSTDKAWLSL